MSKLESNRWPTEGSREARSNDSTQPGTWKKTGHLAAVWEPNKDKED